MEATHDGSNATVQGAAERLAADVRNGAEKVETLGASELKRLIADVEDLLSRVSNLKDADVVRIRGRVEHALASAKQSIASGTESVRFQARRVASNADGYVRESPWQALGIAALVGLAIGILASRRS